jgi:hypothetical protein
MLSHFNFANEAENMLSSEGENAAPAKINAELIPFV